ncbi:MAG TPA: hypothetical protein VK866_00215 [Acidimicrobiales bacterium]|nr:hypothetical protein [Acidimicrobiales bacterium]
MTAVIEKDTATTSEAPAPVIVGLKRRTIDTVLVLAGVVATIVLIVAGGLLLWGNSFAEDYVGDELSAQNITFPPAESLIEEGRDDIAQFGGMQVTTGEHAEAYASFIGGHVANVADGLTYAELGGPQRAAQAAVNEAVAAGAPGEEIAALQAEADTISGQRDTIFKGEMLRGTLLNAYAWSVMGSIAGIAAIAAFITAVAMFGLTVAGVIHLKKTPA